MKDWTISGITHLSTGFPVTMVNNGDNSLLGRAADFAGSVEIDFLSRTRVMESCDATLLL